MLPYVELRTYHPTPNPPAASTIPKRIPTLCIYVYTYTFTFLSIHIHIHIHWVPWALNAQVNAPEGVLYIYSLLYNEVGRKSCSRRRSEPVPLERGCYMGGLPLRAPHVRTLGAEDSSIYIYLCRLCLRGNSRRKEIYNTRMNKHVHTYMPEQLHTYLHTCIHTYIHTYKNMQNPTNSTNPTTNPTNPTNPTLPYIPYHTNPTLHYTYKQHTHVQEKNMIVFNNEASFRGKGCIGPPKTRNTGRLPKQQNITASHVICGAYE